MATEGKIPIYDYLKMSPTDLQKFGTDGQITLLNRRRNPKRDEPKTRVKKGAKEGAKKPKRA